MKWPVFPTKNEKSFIEHFLGSTLNPDRWTSQVTGTGSVTVTDSYCTCNSGGTAASASFIYRDLIINKNISQLWMACIDPVTAGQPSDCIFLVNRTNGPIPDTYDNFRVNVRANAAILGGAGSDELAFNHFNSSHVLQYWNGGSSIWGSAASNAYTPVRNDDYYIIGLEIDGIGQRFRFLAWGKTYVAGYTYEQGLRMFGMSDWVLWSSVEASNDMRLVFGNPYTTNGLTNEWRFEWIRYIESINNQVVDTWVQGYDTVTPNTLNHHYSYDGETFIRQDRTTVAISVGAGSFEDLDVSEADACTDGTTDYLFYTGSSVADGLRRLCVATAPHVSPQNGPWTKFSGNPILSPSGTNESDLVFAYTLMDLSEPDSNKRWKKLYSGKSSVDQKWRLFYATAPSPTSIWTRQGQVLNVGGAGAFDEFAARDAIPIWVDDKWEVWYVGWDSNNFVHLMRATGTDLATLIKDGNSYVSWAAAARTSLTANLTGRTVTVTSTTGFTVDGQVFLDQDATPNNFGLSRVRKILSSTQLELYHGLDGFTTTTPCRIAQIDAVRHFSPRNIYKVGAEWWFYINHYAPFGTVEDGASYNANAMQGGGEVYKHSASFPSDLSPTLQHLTGPVISRGFNGDTRTNENMSILLPPFWKSYNIFLVAAEANPKDIRLFDARYVPTFQQGRTTKNTHIRPLGEWIGMSRRMLNMN